MEPANPENTAIPAPPTTPATPDAPTAPTTIVSMKELTHLIDMHLGAYRQEQPCWSLNDSAISGRGIFARRDIEAGEEIFREHTLLVGPTAHKSTKLNTCTLCYRLLPGSIEEVLCRSGCSLPVCVECSQSERHAKECKLFRKWVPKDVSKINPYSLRILSIVRCFFLNEDDRKLLYAMQANADKYYLLEVERAAACFEHFPKEPEILEYFHRTICAFNTNAFEGRSKIDGHEILVRALFPLGGMLNHVCTPNASHHFDNAETIVVTATRSIAKGEEITTTYTKVIWSTLARKIFLALTKHFTCCCQRCLDPTENGTYLSALFCRETGCKGIVIPVQTKTLQPDWRCLTCENVFPHAKMARYQDFALNTINNRINTSTVADMMRFINELCPRFCPPSNYVLIEAKLNIIWRMSRFKDDYTVEQLQNRDRYRDDILEILQKLGAGECTLKKLITNEID